MLEEHATQITADARWYHRVKLPDSLRSGRCFAPLAVEVASLKSLEREVFGPIVHVVRYKASSWITSVDAVNEMGYGLTLGVHTRIDSVAQRIASRARRQRLREPEHDRRRGRRADRSVARACPAPAPKRAVRTTCIGSERSRLSPSTRAAGRRRNASLLSMAGD